jgi:hypothetical protein
MGLMSSLAKGFFSFILDAISGILIFIGTLLLLFGDFELGIIIFISGCGFLVLSECVSVIYTKFSKDVTGPTGEKGVTDLLVFALSSLAFPILFLLIYVFFAQIWFILVLALTAIPVAVTKVISKGIKMKANNEKVKRLRKKGKKRKKR